MWRESILAKQLAAAVMLIAVITIAASLPGGVGESVRHVTHDLLTTTYDSAWAYETFYSLMADEELRPVTVPIAHRLGFTTPIRHDTALAAQRRSITQDLTAPVEGLVVASFGWHGDPPALSEGLSFRVTPGMAVRAAAAGEVTQLGAGEEGAQLLVIHHGHGVETVYAADISTQVAQGTQLEQGDLIGHARGQSFTFQLRIDGRSIDPAPKLVLRP